MQQDYKSRNDTVIYTFTFVHIRVLMGAKGTALPPKETKEADGQREEEPAQGLEKVFLERDDMGENVFFLCNGHSTSSFTASRVSTLQIFDQIWTKPSINVC